MREFPASIHQFILTINVPQSSSIRAPREPCEQIYGHALCAPGRLCIRRKNWDECNQKPATQSLAALRTNRAVFPETNCSGMEVNTPENPVTIKPESSPKRTWRYTALFVGKIELRKILESRRQMASCTKRTTPKFSEIWTAHSNMG